MTREEILSIAYSIGTVGEPWWLDDEDLMAFVRAIAPRLALTPGEPVVVARVDDLERGGRVRALAMGLALDAPLCTAPQPQREWVGLTDDEIFEVENNVPDEVISDRDWCLYFARAIEAKVKERLNAN